MKVRFSPAAESDLRDIYRWYKKQGEGLARAFLLLLYAAQVGQAFVPAPQRTGLEACLYLSRTRYTKWRNALEGVAMPLKNPVRARL